MASSIGWLDSSSADAERARQLLGALDESDTVDPHGTRGGPHRGLAYVAMTSIRVGGIDKPAYLSVMNSDLTIAGFESTFEQWQKPDVTLWAPPNAGGRVG